MKTEGNMILIFVSIELNLEILLVQDITHRKTEEESSLLLKEGHDSARSGKLQGITQALAPFHKLVVTQGSLCIYHQPTRWRKDVSVVL